MSKLHLSIGAGLVCALSHFGLSAAANAATNRTAANRKTSRRRNDMLAAGPGPDPSAGRKTAQIRTFLSLSRT